MEELGGLWATERVVVASDHFVPASNVRHAEILKTTRDWSNSTGVHNFFEYEGILHSLVLQDRLVHPGMLLVGADSHTTTAGAMGAVAVAVGSTELATVLATGQLWLRVPDTVHIDLSNSPECSAPIASIPDNDTVTGTSDTIVFTNRRGSKPRKFRRCSRQYKRRIDWHKHSHNITNGILHWILICCP